MSILYTIGLIIVFLANLAFLDLLFLGTKANWTSIFIDPRKWLEVLNKEEEIRIPPTPYRSPSLFDTLYVGSIYETDADIAKRKEEQMRRVAADRIHADNHIRNLEAEKIEKEARESLWHSRLKIWGFIVIATDWVCIFCLAF